MNLRVLGVGVWAALAAAPAFGQTAPAATPETLSKKLDQSNGVIHPQDVDPKMNKPAPSVGDRNVVPTPGAAAPQAK